MANTLNSISSSNPAAQDAPTAQSNTATTHVTKNMFLQLLVSQIKNQDPLNPTDGVQFLTQLAQFQQLENGMNMGQDIAAIRSDMDQMAGSLTPSTENK